MSDLVPTNATDPEYQLQRDHYLQAVEHLRTHLPPPDTDTPEAWLRRDSLAIAEVAALVPASPPEVRLAAMHVAAMAHAGHCLRMAVHAQAADDLKLVERLYAQNARMGREARGYLGSLLRLQSVRGKREAKDDTREAAAWSQQATSGLMMDALQQLPAGRPEAPPAFAHVAAQAKPAAAPKPAAPAEKPRWRDYSEWSDEEKREEKLWSDAGRYAVLHTERVKRIRQLGGLPPDCDYEPPPPEILDIIIHGDDANLRWADTYVPYKDRIKA
jgi:hypothetical protein